MPHIAVLPVVAALFLALFPACSATAVAADLERADVLAAMKKAATHFRTKVAVHGGYVYYVSPDLKRRLGEGVATATQVWVQPPGTPTVGTAYLAAYEATGDRWYLDAAAETARCLGYGQLKSGGWTNSIDFDPRGADTAAYRNGRGKGKANSTLDDDITQSALTLLMRVDQALEFKDAEIHEAARFGLDSLLAAQFANGGFPQVWTGPSEDRPVVKARFPEYDWRTEGRVKAYWTQYTLNDGLAGTVAKTLMTAEDVYGDAKAAAALRRLGEFLVRAQLPEPQPGWAQQYDVEMRPIWARKFEPPAVSGLESQDAIETLLTVARHTGDKRFLNPIPAALAWLRRSALPDGRLARFYELKTNRPLYMTAKYELTYDDSEVPSHYGWKVASHADRLAKELEAVRTGIAKSTARTTTSGRRAADLLQALDEEGRWIDRYDGKPLVGQPKFRSGDEYLSSETFSRNLTDLARFLQGPK